MQGLHFFELFKMNVFNFERLREAKNKQKYIQKWSFLHKKSPNLDIDPRLFLLSLFKVSIIIERYELYKSL